MGQQIKVNMARACYSDADIYIFDDPLSEVDMKVSNQIYYECI